MRTKRKRPSKTSDFEITRQSIKAIMLTQFKEKVENICTEKEMIKSDLADFKEPNRMSQNKKYNNPNLKLNSHV